MSETRTGAHTKPVIYHLYKFPVTSGIRIEWEVCIFYVFAKLGMRYSLPTMATHTKNPK